MKLIKKIWENKIFRTFLQTFIAVFAGGFATGMDSVALKSLAVSALSAAICAVMNMKEYLEPYVAYKEELSNGKGDDE